MKRTPRSCIGLLISEDVSVLMYGLLAFPQRVMHVAQAVLRSVPAGSCVCVLGRAITWEYGSSLTSRFISALLGVISLP